MTSRERLLAVFNHRLPDRVPTTPDISNMVPCRLTGKPFWDIYLYQDPPLWKAYIDAVKKLGIDGFMESVFPLDFAHEIAPGPPWSEMIIYRDDNRIITRKFCREGGVTRWSENVRIYDRDNPATAKHYTLMGLPAVPDRWEPVIGVREWPSGEALLALIKEEMGDHGLVGHRCGTTLVVTGPEDILDYHDNPAKYERKRDEMIVAAERRLKSILAMKVRPDFLAMGASGTLVWQSPAMFRELGLPILKRMSALCKEAGIPSHVHSCGPATALIKMAAEETDLISIDPLERPPMGDCNLCEIKQRYGGRLVLKGNLHTTDTMLRGSYDSVLATSRQCIADAAEGGMFILSTGDQCGRDTPLENFRAMIDACDRYGRY
jgi:uroporphyrinogen decarboxylase